MSDETTVDEAAPVSPAETRHHHDHVEKQLNRIEEKANTMSVNLTNLQTLLAETKTKVEGLEGLADQLKTNVDELKKAVEGNPAAEAAVEALESTFTQLNQGLDKTIATDTPEEPAPTPTPASTEGGSEVAEQAEPADAATQAQHVEEQTAEAAGEHNQAEH